MQYLQHQLDNGLTILAERNPEAYTAAFGFFVKTGARDESPAIGGVSHFLEHMVFKGTPQRTAEQVNRELDEMGASSNARTGEESTIYHATVLPEFQTPIVELLADLMRPSLRTEDFEMEKQVIIEEIQMYQDQPPYGGHEKIMELFFGSHALGQSVLGTTESVGDLTVEQMRQFFNVHYSPGNIALAAAGDIDFDRLVRDAERLCGSWENLPIARQTAVADYQTGFENLAKPSSQQHYLLQLAPGPSNADPRRYAMRVATAILGDDCGSRMYWKLLDTGLAESAGAGSYEYCDNGLVMSFVCCDPEFSRQNLDILGQMQNQMQADGVTEKELALAKRKIESQIVLASERTENRMFSVGSHWLSGQPFKSVAEVVALYQALSLADVNEAIRSFPLTRNFTLFVGPDDSFFDLAGLASGARTT
jgi:predicted Zn-dependent peptidase